jgi:hypothetical protein
VPPATPTASNEPWPTWGTAFNAIFDFCAENGRLPDPTIAGERHLVEWIRRQDRDRRRGALSPAKTALLEQVPQWSWPAADESNHYREVIQALRALKEPEPVPGPNSVDRSGRGSDSHWLHQYEQVRSFAALHGRLPSRGGQPDEAWLGRWCRIQRYRYRGTYPDSLTVDEITQLEQLGSWYWERQSRPLTAWPACRDEAVAFLEQNRRMPRLHADDADERRIYRWIRKNMIEST